MLKERECVSLQEEIQLERACIAHLGWTGVLDMLLDGCFTSVIPVFYPYLWMPLFFMIRKWRHRIVACFFGPKPAPISERMHVVPVRVCNFFRALFEPVRVFFSCRVCNFLSPYSNRCVFFFLPGKQFFQVLIRTGACFFVQIRLLFLKGSKFVAAVC